MFLALPSHTDGVVDAGVRCAVSKGAVLDADKPAKDLRGVAVWIGAGQFHRVLAAQATLLHRGRGATFSETLAFCAVFAAQPACVHLGGATIDRAGVAAMLRTGSLSIVVGDVRAAIHYAHLLLPSPPPSFPHPPPILISALSPSRIYPRCHQCRIPHPPSLQSARELLLRRTAPHFYPVTNRVICHFISWGQIDGRQGKSIPACRRSHHDKERRAPCKLAAVNIPAVHRC